MPESSKEKVSRWRSQNPERNREINRIAAVRVRARRLGLDPDQAVIDYESKKQHRAEIINNPPTQKQCTKCGVVKPRDEFRTRLKALDGLESGCKACKAVQFVTWQRKNRERLAAKARERYATSAKTRQVSLNGTKRYKARKKGCGLLDLTAKQWEAIKLAYSQRCAYCKQKKPLTQDHVIPISKGGQHTASNIVPACQSCNSSKGAGEPKAVFQPHLVC